MYTLLQHFKDVFPVLVALSLAIFTLTQLTVLKKHQLFWLSATVFSLGLTIVYIYLVIIDNASTGYLVCRRSGDDDCGVYPFFYKGQYILNEWWTVLTSISLVFGWIIFPIFSELMRVEGKLNTSTFKKILHSKWPYYLCLICSYFAWVLLSFLITRKAKFDIKNFGIVYSNTWSLLVIIPFLSTGLVELPKYLWNRSNPKKYLAHLQQTTPKIRKELFDAEMEFSESIALFVDIMDQLDPSDECYDLANHIYSTSPEFKYGSNLLPSSQFNHPLPITSSYITSVYNKITGLKQTQSKLQTQWNNHLKTSFLVEDVVDNLYSSDHRLTSSLKILTGDRMENFKLSISWWYNVYLVPVFLKLLSVLFFILGIVIAWSEITFTATSPTLSIIAILFEKNNGNYNIQNCITLVILPYMFLATAFGLLSIKPFKHYSITINRQNDLHSIFWICMQLVVIAPTLIYNYLIMAQMGDYGKHPIVFNHMYSYFMDSASFLGKYFNYYLPIVIGVFVILIVFKLHVSLQKLTNLNIIEYYSELECAKVDGRSILASERSKREREFQPDNNISEGDFNQNSHNIGTN